MSRAMVFDGLLNLLQYISENNSPMRRKDPSFPCIKYVDPHIDMRTNTCFALTLRGFGMADQLFHTQNEFRDVQESLHQRVMRYLNTPIGEFKEQLPPQN